MARLSIVRAGSDEPVLQAEPRQLEALLAAARILNEMSVYVLDRISREGPHGELYDELRAAVEDDEIGTPAAIIRVTTELLGR
jgi:hypothetical protein